MKNPASEAEGSRLQGEFDHRLNVNFDGLRFPVDSIGEVIRFSKRLTRGFGFTLAFSIIFAISFPAEPLYYSNQNTKFLHGLAQAGLGNLGADWTAATVDPL